MNSIWGGGGGGAPDAWHFACVVYFALGVVGLRFFLDRLIFRRLSIWLLCPGAISLNINETTHAKVIKCSESMGKLTYYATVEVYVLTIACRDPWFRDSKEYFRGWRNQELKQHRCPPYMGNSKEGFFRDDVSSCDHSYFNWILINCKMVTVWYSRRPTKFSFKQLATRHIAVFTLVHSSDPNWFFRIGSVILALHDASDVFLEATKVFKYSENELGASVCFGLFAVSWLVLRLIFFPFWVIKSSSYDVREFFRLSETYPSCLYYVFNTVLLTLLVFHIYWWILISSMIMRQLKNRGKIGEDIRSDSEDDE